jgi:hypothetical protein
VEVTLKYLASVHFSVILIGTTIYSDNDKPVIFSANLVDISLENVCRIAKEAVADPSGHPGYEATFQQ